MIGKSKYRGIKEGVILAVVAGLILAAGWEVSRVYGAQKAYTPSNLIRLHIIGNSDTQTDIDAKLKVRDVIFETFGQALTDMIDAGEAEDYIRSNLEKIENLADQCLFLQGFDYKAKAAVGRVMFPDRTYTFSSGETVFLPQGYYKSLQITLGKGEGSNWWCIMYPALCYIDLVHGNNLEPGIYDCHEPFIETNASFIFLDETLTKEAPIQIRFFIIELIKKGWAAITQRM